MRRNKLIVAAAGVILMLLAIFILIRELKPWPASMGSMAGVGDAVTEEATITPDQKGGDAPNSSPDTLPDTDQATSQNTIQNTSNYTQDNSNHTQTTSPDNRQDTSDTSVSQAEDATQTTVIQEESKMFCYTELSQEIKDRITGTSYPENCTVAYDELRYVSVLYWGFDGLTHTGELIVNQAIAQDIVDIFEELYDRKYPIEQMVLVDEYAADDNASMAADNTSSFNYRPIPDGSRLSLHSYGLAIDINPLYNPYIREVEGETVILPENGAIYADRTLDCEYYIRKDDICYNAFVSRGFTWGGDWKNQKDYQHFQKKIEGTGNAP